MKKTKTLADKIKEQRKMPYKDIAKKFNTTDEYVYKIARGMRKGTRGKGAFSEKRT